jgi:methylation protein EvaC
MNNICRACKSKKLYEILNLGNMPSAGGFLKSLKDTYVENKYPLPIFTCKDCGLVQIINPIDPSILFKDYAFSSSTVSPLIKHFKDYAKWLNNNFRPKSVMEFGCNDGILLKPLQELGIFSVGVDISENITAIAKKNGLKVETGFFNKNLSHDLKVKYGHFDLVTGSNAFAHNENPGEILDAAKACLSENGVLVLEIMYAGDLIDKLQWDTLYHEHLTFYSLGTLEILLSRYGFNVFDAIKIPMHGGSLRVAASLNKRHHTQSYLQVRDYESSIKLNTFETWSKFGRQIAKKIFIVGNALQAISKTKTIWAYGAAGKATMWLNACNMNYLGAIVDESPLRAGRYMPGTHTPIVYPTKLKESPPDYIFITAWNYADVIKAKESWFEGTWITPLPDMKFF